MEIVDFFEPVSLDGFDQRMFEHPLSLANTTRINDSKTGFPSIDNVGIAIVGVQESRNSVKKNGCELAPDFVRKQLYAMFQGSSRVKVADLGNIQAGNQVNDTYFALKTTIADLVKRNIVPVVLGGSQDLTLANYQAYEELGQIVNMVSVDPKFDLGLQKDGQISNEAYLNHIFTREPNYLFNYTNLGYQTYLVDQDAIDLMSKLNFDTYRLGVVRKNIEEVEPVVRNADILSFDVSSIRSSDAPGSSNPSPNGLYGEEACQIARYAGLGDKLSSIGFYEFNPLLDTNQQTSKLVAQMIWYFIDGYGNRKGDTPSKLTKESSDFVKYMVPIREFNNEITFYKSKESDRWWMEIPCPASLRAKYERQILVPCSYQEYKSACNDEIPEKWLQAYRKLL